METLLKLSPAQSLLLRTAARRADGRVIPPDTLRGGARVKVLTALLQRGWIEPADSGHVLTDAGYAAIGQLRPVPLDDVQPVDTTDDIQLVEGIPIRPGTKLAALVIELRRPQGATSLQLMLATNGRVRGNTTRATVPYLLKGIVFGSDGRALSPWHTTKKNGRRYRYYVPQRDCKEYAGASGLPRLPAAELESAVLDQLRAILRAPNLLGEVLPQAIELDPSLDEAQVTVAMTRLDAIWDQLFPAEQTRIVRLLVEKVIVSPNNLEVRLRANGIERLVLELCPEPVKQTEEALSDIRIQKTGEPDILQTSDGRLTLSVPIQIKRRSGRKLVTLPNGETAPVRPWDMTPTPLQLALARGHRWLAMLESGEAKSLKEIAAREGIDNSYVSRMVNLITLAPDIVAAILDDTLPNHVTLFDLAVDPPALWDEQREKVGL